MKANTAQYDNVGGGMSKTDLIEHLQNESQVLQNETIKRAFKNVDRRDFVQPDYHIEAYEDYALPIGYEQTISQPTTVAFMLELLELNEGDYVLDVGSGSGWTTALLAEIVGSQGSVTGLEIIPELVEQGQENLDKYNYPYAEIKDATENPAKLHTQKYDRILVSADAEEVPKELLAQLKPHGIMVIPIQNAICKFKKIAEDDIQEMRFPGFTFVPLK